MSDATSRATLVWLGLTGATLISWSLGTGHGVGTPVTAGVAILAVALVKVRLVGLHFMELRDAPALLRLVFEAYCAVVLVALVAMYLVGS